MPKKSRDQPKTSETSRTVQITIPGRAVPWKAPEHGRTKDGHPISFSPKAYKTWKEVVAAHARVAMAGQDPLEGYLQILVSVCMHKKGQIPDLTNMVKGIEDGLQKVVYNNDQMISVQVNRRVFVPITEKERVEVTVFTLSPKAVGATDDDDQNARLF